MLPFTTTVTPEQAWAILVRHAHDDIEPLHLRELCKDNDRVSSLVSVHNNTTNRSLIVDLSRQRMTLETMGHLMKLANAKNIRKFITTISWGQNNKHDPFTPRRAQQYPGHNKKQAKFDEQAKQQDHSQLLPTEQQPLPTMHLALRVPDGKGYEMLLQDGTNALRKIHTEWERIERIAESIRKATFRGASGGMIRDLVVVGRGTPIAALRFVYSALLKDETAVQASKAGMMTEMTTARIKRNLTGILHSSEADSRRLRFVSSIDPVEVAAAVSDLDPASTLVISFALEGNEDTGLATKILKTWFLQSLSGTKKPDLVLSQHMMLITANESIASMINKPDNVYLIPKHCRCEGFTSFTAATLLPLSIIFGWSIAKEFLLGAHDMDIHFVDSNLRHNIPVLLALTDTWSNVLLNESSRTMMSFTGALNEYPSFVATLESQTCAKEANPFYPHKVTCSNTIVDGSQSHFVEGTLFHRRNPTNVELLTAMNTQVGFNASKILGSNNADMISQTRDALMCSFFSYADELAVGSLSGDANESDYQPEGNRPSTLLICDKIDAFACGQLVALAEHRAIVKAHLWEQDPFLPKHGSSIASKRSEWLSSILHELNSDEDELSKYKNSGMLNLSTKTILSHYLNTPKS